MRALALVALVCLLTPVALASHALPLDGGSRILGCQFALITGGSTVSLNCPGVQRTAATSETAGTYRLTVAWDAVAPEWTEFQAGLISCSGACAPPATSSICVNSSCAGSPPPGANVVHQAATISASPLVLTIPTSGPETNVSFAFNVNGPLVLSLDSQAVNWTLEHI